MLIYNDLYRCGVLPILNETQTESRRKRKKWSIFRPGEEEGLAGDGGAGVGTGSSSYETGNP